MDKLLTLNGKAKTGADLRFSLFSLAGNKSYGAATMSTDPRKLSDIDAGIWFLHRLTKEYPRLTWQELIGSVKTSGWLTDSKNFLGDTIRDAGNVIGGWTGDAVRLAADPEVVNAVGKYGAMYASGGASSALEGLGGLQGIVGGIGQQAKQKFNDPNFMLYLIGGGVFIVALIMILKGKNNVSSNRR